MRCNHHLYFETRCEHVSIHRRLSHVIPGPQDRIPSLGLKYLRLYKVRVDPGAVCRSLPNLLLDSLRSAMLYRFLHFECDRSRTFVGYRNNQSWFSYVVVCKWLSSTTPLLSEFVVLLPVRVHRRTCQLAPHLSRTCAWRGRPAGVPVRPATWQPHANWFVARQFSPRTAGSMPLMFRAAYQRDCKILNSAD